MASVTQPLHDEHQTLLPRIEALRTTADSVAVVGLEALCKSVDESYAFLEDSLMPHATAEERVLYPEVQRLLGAAQATATMSRDHTEVQRLMQQLKTLRSGMGAAELSPSQSNEMRRILYGLYALLHVHFAKEEEVYLPLLDSLLTADEARKMFERMEQAAEAARGH